MSVYRCRLSQMDLEHLNWKLSQILTGEDDLLIVGICDRCAMKIRDNSGRTDWTADTTTFEII